MIKDITKIQGEGKPFKLQPQLFSGDDPVVVNPNTQTTSTSGLSNENKTYYHDTLIDNAEPYLVHDQFAQEINIPEHGGKTVEVRYFDVLNKNVTALTEGVTPDGTSLSMGVKNATVSQYGGYVTLSDVINVTAIDPMLVQATKAMGSQAGRSLDTITRNVITAGTNVLYCPGKEEDPDYDGEGDAPIIDYQPTARAELNSTCKLDVDTILRAAAMLENNLAETINGSYVAIIHPLVKYDLMRNPEFIEWHKYASPEELFRGEIGMIGNVRFVVSTEARIVKASSASDAMSVFITMVIGKDAYATTYARGLGLEHIVKPLGAGEDPLNQRATAGWKATKAALRLKEQNMVRIESACTLGLSAAAN